MLARGNRVDIDPGHERGAPKERTRRLSRVDTDVDATSSTRVEDALRCDESIFALVRFFAIIARPSGRSGGHRVRTEAIGTTRARGRPRRNAVLVSQVSPHPPIDPTFASERLRPLGDESGGERAEASPSGRAATDQRDESRGACSTARWQRATHEE